jgi:hypothetical protein
MLQTKMFFFYFDQQKDCLDYAFQQTTSKHFCRKCVCFQLGQIKNYQIR